MATEKINGVWHVSNKTSGGGGGGGTDPNAVHFTQQSLTTEQQAQARTNIGAGTYSKPSGGIPASDLASGVIPSVPVTDVTVGGTSVVSSGTAVIPAIPDVSGKENTSNKVTSLSAQSTDTQYPSARCVYDLIGDVETLINAL